MLKEIQIKNFKSILDDTISVGRVNVFIGENCCGNSNILEALMFASVAETYETIDADILNSYGIRVCKPSLTISSFKGKRQADKIEVNLQFSNNKVNTDLIPENSDNIFSKWKKSFPFSSNEFGDFILDFNKEFKTKNGKKPDILSTEQQLFLSELKNQLYKQGDLIKAFKESQSYEDLTNYLIFTLSTEALRGINPNNKKGIHGEHLDIIINELTKEEKEELNEYLYTISWLEDFFIDTKDELKAKGYKLNYSKSLLYFRDKYMMKKNNFFSSENSNEGILHVLFYLAYLISSKTSRFFAIDNIDTSLNPHLCQHVMFEMCKLAKKHDKQMLITTHNPAILDGLNLNDDEIRLFEVFRTDNGDTKTRRILVKPKVEGEQYKLSDLWTRGFLGAISEKF